MGMFDELHIDKVHLPDNLKNHEIGWQTKDYSCELDILEIDKTGQLWVTRSGYCYRGDENEEKIEKTSYSGNIYFYDNVDEVWTTFNALFDKGQMVKLTQIEPIPND